MKHSKGPWRRSGNIIWGAEIQSKVAQVYSPYIPGEESTAETEKANARLITAAPEMLEVLQDVLKAIQRDEGAGQTYDSYVKNFGHDVENVIRKATGEE